MVYYGQNLRNARWRDGKKMIPLLLAACLMLTACGTKKAETPEFEFQAETDGAV